MLSLSDFGVWQQREQDEVTFDTSQAFPSRRWSPPGLDSLVYYVQDIKLRLVFLTIEPACATRGADSHYHHYHHHPHCLDGICPAEHQVSRRLPAMARQGGESEKTGVR